jgi:hypothetical protein
MVLLDDLDLALQQAVTVAFLLAVSLFSMAPLAVPESLSTTAHFGVTDPPTHLVPLRWPITYCLR